MKTGTTLTVTPLLPPCLVSTISRHPSSVPPPRRDPTPTRGATPVLSPSLQSTRPLRRSARCPWTSRPHGPVTRPSKTSTGYLGGSRSPSPAPTFRPGGPVQGTQVHPDCHTDPHPPPSSSPVPTHYTPSVSASAPHPGTSPGPTVTGEWTAREWTRCPV